MRNRNISFSPPDINSSDIEAVTQALKSGWITTGPQTKEFEKEISKYIGTNHTVALNSCTAGLELTLRILGIGEGDEVIVPSYTYTATAAVVNHVGAKIVMVDTNPDSFEMDYTDLFNKINKQTKVIIPVDIAGIPCDYDEIFNIIEKLKHKFKPKNEIQNLYNRIIVLADAAHSFGATYKNQKIGNVADFTSFSFHAVKNLTTGEGGAVTWKAKKGLNEKKLYKDFMLYSLHGQSKDALSKDKAGQWEYDIIAPLYKCNMTDIVASIGRKQLERYPNFLSRRKEIITKYNSYFKNEDIFITPDHYSNKKNSSGHLYLLRIIGIQENERNEIIEKMSKKGIATNVHYKPLPLLTAYKNLGFNINEFPNAFNQYKNEISLPLHTLLTDEDVDYIATSLIEIVEGVKNNVQ